MRITYEPLPRQDRFLPHVHELIDRTRPSVVYELGGGAYPLLSPSLIADKGLEYVVVDVSAEQLDLAPDRYTKLHADLGRSDFVPPQTADLVLSRWFLEHVRDPATLHRNVLAMLRPGGRAVHYFTTLYSLPFVLNRILPDPVSIRLVRLAEPGRLESGHGKFPAHYRWCRGPTKRQLRRFREIGFELDSYTAYLGHYYLDRIGPAQRAEDRLAAFLARRHAAWATSYALVELRKPAWPKFARDRTAR